MSPGLPVIVSQGTPMGRNHFHGLYRACWGAPAGLRDREQRERRRRVYRDAALQALGRIVQHWAAEHGQ